MIYSLFILLTTALCIVTENVQITVKNGQELLLCRKCGADVADSYYLFTKQSPGARKTEKQQLFGKQNVTVQTLVNPFGVQFDIVTAEKARCETIGPPQGADSWFPGYAWRICACPHCGQHLGWTFEKSGPKVPGIDDTNDDQTQSFHGLILSNILGENYVEVLLHEAISNVSQKNWEDCVKDAEKLQEEDLKKSHLAEEFVIHVDDDDSDVEF